MKIKKLLNYNLKSLLGFEIIYKLLTTIIFVPLFLTCFKLITNLTGFNNFTFYVNLLYYFRYKHRDNNYG